MLTLLRKALGTKRQPVEPPVDDVTADLPLANVHETCLVLRERLEKFNRADSSLDPRARLRHLEAFRTPIDDVGQRLQHMTLELTLPAHASIVETALTGRQLYIELALGYKSIINDVCSAQASMIDTEFPRLVIKGALNALSSVLRLSYSLYWPTPVGVWREVNQLYHFAKRNGLTETDDDQKPESIAALYKNVTLMWLSNPYGFTPSEQFTLNEIIYAWGYLLQLHDEPTNDAHFVAMSADTPPTAAQWTQTQDTAPVYIATTRICTVLREHERDRLPLITRPITPPENFELSTVAARLIPDLLELWQGRKTRASERRQSASSKLLVVGLGASHHYLADRRRLGHNKPSSKRASEAIDSTTPEAQVEPPILPPSAVFHSKAVDVAARNRIHSSNANKTLHQLRLPIDVSPQVTSPLDARTHRTFASSGFTKVLCRIINESATGACLLFRGKDEARLRVGELVTLFSLGDEKYRAWGVGTIRWLRHFQSHYVLVGIERVVPNATAVATKVCDPSGKYSDYLRSLLITDYHPAQRAAAAPTLITAQVPYRTGDTILMHYLGEEKRLILGSTVRSTNRFRQFTFDDPDAKRQEYPSNVDTARGR